MNYMHDTFNNIVIIWKINNSIIEHKTYKNNCSVNELMFYYSFMYKLGRNMGFI